VKFKIQLTNTTSSTSPTTNDHSIVTDSACYDGITCQKTLTLFDSRMNGY
jgi:hypothetical protein